MSREKGLDRLDVIEQGLAAERDGYVEAIAAVNLVLRVARRSAPLDMADACEDLLRGLRTHFMVRKAEAGAALARAAHARVVESGDPDSPGLGAPPPPPVACFDAC